MHAQILTGFPKAQVTHPAMAHMQVFMERDMSEQVE
jgi:hypothetical protein